MDDIAKKVFILINTKLPIKQAIDAPIDLTAIIKELLIPTLSGEFSMANLFNISLIDPEHRKVIPTKIAEKLTGISIMINNAYPSVMHKNFILRMLAIDSFKLEDLLILVANILPTESIKATEH